MEKVMIDTLEKSQKHILLLKGDDNVRDVKNITTLAYVVRIIIPILSVDSGIL